MSNTMSEGSGSFLDTFIHGTGWSVYERPDPNAEIGVWDDESKEEQCPAAEETETGNSSGSDSPVERRSETGPRSEHFNMSTIQEGEMSETGHGEGDTEHGDDKCRDP